MTKKNQMYWDILNAMSPEQKINAFNNLYWTARELKAAGVRLEFPNLTDAEVQEKVKEIFLHAHD